MRWKISLGFCGKAPKTQSLFHVALALGPLTYSPFCQSPSLFVQERAQFPTSAKESKILHPLSLCYSLDRGKKVNWFKKTTWNGMEPTKSWDHGTRAAVTNVQTIFTQERNFNVSFPRYRSLLATCGSNLPLGQKSIECERWRGTLYHFGTVSTQSIS